MTTEKETKMEPVKKKERTPAAKASTVYNQLKRIDAEEAEELAASPETIREKHARRRDAAKKSVTDPEVLRLALAMYGAAPVT